MTTLVDRIKSTAKSKYGWNLKTTAQKAGIGVNSIYRWKEQTPTTESLQKVAKVLDVSVDYLLGNDSKTNSDTKKVVDIDDDTVLLSFDGKPIPEEDKELFKRLLRGK